MIRFSNISNDDGKEKNKSQNDACFFEAQVASRPKTCCVVLSLVVSRVSCLCKRPTSHESCIYMCDQCVCAFLCHHTTAKHATFLVLPDDFCSFGKNSWCEGNSTHKREFADSYHSRTTTCLAEPHRQRTKCMPHREIIGKETTHSCDIQ